VAAIPKSLGIGSGNINVDRFAADPDGKTALLSFAASITAESKGMQGFVCSKVPMW
jgi:hypothetical protein